MKAIVVLGPTATGKTDLAVMLARRLPGRVISADSVQVYRGLDIGSCKPPLPLRSEIPHALIDVASPDTYFSAGMFARMALAACEQARAAGAVPVIAGGTGLYLRALLCGLAPMPPRDEELRAQLYERARRGAPADLHAELERRDPESAARLGPNDLQRIVRALEVVILTGISLSAHIRARGFTPDRLPTLKVGLRMDRGALYRRVEDRVDRMFREGLVAEVRGLLSSGLREDCHALKALGYREVVAHLRGEADLDRTVALVKQNTRRYARRQMAWFRREAGVEWFDADGGPERLAGIAEDVAALWRRRSGVSSGVADPAGTRGGNEGV